MGALALNPLPRWGISHCLFAERAVLRFSDYRMGEIKRAGLPLEYEIYILSPSYYFLQEAFKLQICQSSVIQTTFSAIICDGGDSALAGI